MIAALRSRSQYRAAFLVGCLGVGGAAAFAFNAIAGRLLGPSLYGVLAAALALSNLMTPVAAFGMGQAILHLDSFRAGAAQANARYSAGIATITTIASGLILLGAGLRLVEGSSAQLLLGCTAILLARSLGAVLSGLGQAERRDGLQAASILLEPMLRLAVIVACFALSFGAATDAIASIWIGGLLAAIGTLWLLYRSTSHGTRQTHAPWRALARPGALYSLNATVYLVFQQSDLVVLGFVTTAEAVGTYAAASVLVASTYLVPAGIVQRSMAKEIFAAAADGSGRRRALRTRLYKTVLPIGIGLAITLSIAGPLLVSVFYGAEYEPVGLLLRWFSIIVPLRFMVAIETGLRVLPSESREITVLQALVIPVSIVMNLVIGGRLGAAAGGLTSIVAESLLLALIVTCLRLDGGRATAPIRSTP